MLSTFQYEDEILEILTSNADPETLLALRPSPALQTRVSELLQRNKQDALSREEEIDLDRYLKLEHLVRMVKAYAARGIGSLVTQFLLF